MLELARREGFWEHYNPLTGRGQGGEQFAWTAGLVLDLLAARGGDGVSELATTCLNWKSAIRRWTEKEE